MKSTKFYGSSPSEIPSPDNYDLPDQPNISLDEERAYSQIKNDAFRQDSDLARAQRKKYADRIFVLLVVWLCTLVVILILSGFSTLTGFNLTDTVLMTLIGSTTASMIGIFLIVANYLFPKRNR